MRVRVEVSGVPGGRDFVVEGEHQFTPLEERVYSAAIIFHRTALGELAKAAGMALDEICADLGVADIGKDALTDHFVRCFIQNRRRCPIVDRKGCTHETQSHI